MPHIIDYLLFDEYTSDPPLGEIPEGGFWYNTTEDRLKQKISTVSGTQVRTYTIVEDIPAHPVVVANTEHTTTLSGNPHYIVKGDIGLGSVVDGAQLLRSPGDFSFTEKTSPAAVDYILIEDSENLGAKKIVRLGNLPTISGSGEDIDNVVWDTAGSIVYDNSGIAVRRV